MLAKTQKNQGNNYTKTQELIFDREDSTKDYEIQHQVHY